MNEKGSLALKPIRFKNICFLGNMGYDWIPAEYNLSKLITQNILYAMYHSAKTISELSELLNVPESLIEDEIDYLEDNGLIDCLVNDKYRANMLIHDFSKEIYEARHLVLTKCAKIVCEKYVKLIINTSTSANIGKSGLIYVPNNDINFLLWAIITSACVYRLNNSQENELLENYFIKRNDGSENIPIITLNLEDKLSFDENKFNSFIWHNLTIKPSIGFPFIIQQANSLYDTREIDWSQIFQQEFTDLYEYISKLKNINPKSNHPFCEGDNQSHQKISDFSSFTQNINVTKTLLSIEKLDRLRKKGYLVFNDVIKNSEYINMIVSTIPKEEFLYLLPSIPDDLTELKKQLCEELYNICKSQYPEHKQELAHAYYKNIFSSGEMITRVLDHLLNVGVLKPLTDNQKKTVNMMMFI
ncbi:MAG: hypothetical protein FWG98_08420 [Candidatus Cloacimonetes bacterium]|nr:hypothetical protein [Candidatus Cloacimonadota bacterium]